MIFFIIPHYFLILSSWSLFNIFPILYFFLRSISLTVKLFKDLGYYLFKKIHRIGLILIFLNVCLSLNSKMSFNSTFFILINTILLHFYKSDISEKNKQVSLSKHLKHVCNEKNYSFYRCLFQVNLLQC